MLPFPLNCSHETTYEFFKKYYNSRCGDQISGNRGKIGSIYYNTGIVGKAFPMATTTSSEGSGPLGYLHRTGMFSLMKMFSNRMSLKEKILLNDSVPLMFTASVDDVTCQSAASGVNVQLSINYMYTRHLYSWNKFVLATQVEATGGGRGGWTEGRQPRQESDLSGHLTLTLERMRDHASYAAR